MNRRSRTPCAGCARYGSSMPREDAASAAADAVAQQVVGQDAVFVPERMEPGGIRKRNTARGARPVMMEEFRFESHR